MKTEQFRRRRSPYGFIFYDVAETEKLETKSRQAQQMLREAGFERIIPASIDFPETFEAAGNSDVFHLRDYFGADLALRSDVTAQVIKGFANTLEVKMGDRRFYYATPVFRDVHKSYPSLREIYQLGAECIGVTAEKIIPELLQLADTIVKDVFESKADFILSNVETYHVLQKFLTTNSTDSQPNGNLLKTVLWRDAPELSNQLQLVGKIDRKIADRLALWLLYPVAEKNHLATFQTLRENIPSTLAESLYESFLPSNNLSATLLAKSINVTWQPLLAPRAGYYSGLVFEGYLPGIVSPPVRGGAYDHLVEKYSHQSLPASGFALDMSALI